MAEKDPFGPGDRIGNYVVEDELGRGGMEIVYRCRHRHLDRAAAVSVLTRRDFADRWLRGANLLSGLNHPNIVKLFDVGMERDVPWIACQYVEGESLSSLAKREGTIELRVLLRLMATIAGALQHAHESGVLHKSIQPLAIVIDRSGEPVLVGFSNAAPAAGETQSPDGTVFGVPAYMSPEHWTDRCIPASDVWSLGAVLYRLLTGERPIEADSYDEIARLVLSPEPVDLAPLAGKTPEYVTAIVRRCLEREPGRRYPSADALRSALEAALDYSERSDAPTAAATLPAPGQTVLAHVEYRESELPGAFRHYRVGEYLGGGGFGDVFRAEDELSGREVAMKVLKPKHLADGEAVARFRREATLLSRLHHPNVVEVHNFGRYGTTFFLAMEMLGPRTLEDVLEADAPLGPEDALPIAASVLDGLAAIHESGVVHRDLKPSNVAIDGDRVVLFDLGVAHAADLATLTGAGAFVGTVRYAAPEQALSRSVSGATDVYAAGVVLYEMLTARTPHEADSALGVLRAIASEPPVPVTAHRADLPPGLVALLDAMLAKSPADRPSAREARAALAGE